jgi:tetratricopeptide (TPR) repeat protein
MSRFDERRWLPVLALLAAFTITAQAQAPVQTPTQPAVPPPLTSPATAAPATPLTPEQIGDSLSSHQRYQAAIAAYAKEVNPTPSLWNKMGIAYQMMFNLKDATRCYNASLKLDPRNAQVLNNIATVYDSLKQYKTAERYYHKALKIDSKSALILRNLGSNQLSQHKDKKGWEAYQSALAIDPQIFQTRSGASVENPASTQERGAMHYYMARSCVSTGNSECAIQNLRLALNEGYTSPKKIAEDGSFASLHELPAFQQMIAAQSAPQ